MRGNVDVAVSEVRRSGGGPHILIIVENLPVPLDRRVWLECQALVNRGYRVSVICPKGPGDPARQHLDGIDIYKYKPSPEATGLAGYAWEFAYGWLRAAALSVRVWRHNRFDVLQACNPPDTLWLLARLWRARGVRFVFDHHDLNPELFYSRFGAPKTAVQRAELRGLRWLERMTFRTAQHVISTNESYKKVAIQRGRRRPDEVTIVRSGPDTSRMRPIYPEHPRPRHSVNLVYLGIMGPQDGVDQALLVLEELIHRRGRDDITATFLGFGDCWDQLRAQCSRLKLDHKVTFTGRVGKAEIAEHLSRSDIGLCPDLKTPLNDVSTMNKTMEYMAYGLPSVSFDLAETIVSGDDCVLYVPSGDVRAFADEVERLVDDVSLRAELGARARTRVSNHLDWKPQARAYVGVYDDLTGFSEVLSPAVLMASQRADKPETDEFGRRYVNLDDPDEFARYLRERRAPAHRLSESALEVSDH